MCGIFGALGRLDDEVLDRVSAAMAHRGPDAHGRFVSDEATLLHRRLKVIDLTEAAAQPLGNEDGSVQVVFNGEIYNHRALRRELDAAGHRFRSHSDTEVIVHGYEEHGADIVDRLDGMFAFGLWDRARGRLLLARDRAGKKPLFYTLEGGGLRFASTIAALHAAGAPRELALGQLPFYLSFGFFAPPHTAYQGVQQLAPATRLLVTPGQAPTIERYWKARFGEAPTRDPFPVARQRVRELVVAAVERRLEADVPIGAFLSGGIDSTIVVATMQTLLDRPVKTFSIGFAGDARYDETHYARLAAQTFGTEHTEFQLTPLSFELVEELVRHHDGPFGDSSAIPTYVVSRLTREHVTVALTGDGGDELFCGYVRFLAAEWSERIPSSLRRLGGALAAQLPPSASERSLAARARRFLGAAALPLPDRIAQWNTFFDPYQVLRPDLVAALGAQMDTPLSWQRGVFAEAHGETPLSRVLEHNFRTYLPFDLLVKADRTSMAHALELRSPFLDTALVEYAATLPPKYLRRGPVTKHILKEAFRDLLPEAIRTRGKMGFGVPLGAWFRGGVRDYLHDHLRRGARLDAYLDRGAVDALLKEHDCGRGDHGQRLWALLTLEVWLRSFQQEQRRCAA